MGGGGLHWDNTVMNRTSHTFALPGTFLGQKPIVHAQSSIREVISPMSRDIIVMIHDPNKLFL